MTTFLRVRDHVELVKAVCDAWRYDATDAEWEAYMMALADVPLPHCIKAAVELVRTQTEDYRPNRSRWRELACRLYNDELRRIENQYPRITEVPLPRAAREAQQREWHNMLLERAAEGDEWCKTLVEALGGFGNKRQIKRFQEDTYDKRAAEAEAYVERSIAEKLAKLTPEQLEQRRRRLIELQKPPTFIRWMCAGCGKTIHGDAAYSNGDLSLCAKCQPRYSWAREGNG